MNIIELERLHQTVKLFSTAQSEFFGENCIVALEISNHVAGCKLNIEGDRKDSFIINWSKKVNRAGYKEEKKIVEHAAEAIAFLLTPKMTEFTVIEEATIGTGIDYWLGYEETHTKYNPKNFLQARLEISGIMRETPTNTVLKRVNEKKNQTRKSDKLKLPAYISVTEFASPKTYFGKK